MLDAGPNRASSFRVVGAQFVVVYADGAYPLGGPGTAPGAAGGSRALGLAQGETGFVELVPTHAGRHAFVSHFMVDAGRGAHRILDVTR